MKKKDLEKRIKLLEIQVDNLTREFDEALTSKGPIAGFLEEAIQRYKEDNEPAMTREELEAAKPKMTEHIQEHLKRVRDKYMDANVAGESLLNAVGERVRRDEYRRMPD